jgi:hypothetical protein
VNGAWTNVPLASNTVQEPWLPLGAPDGAHGVFLAWAEAYAKDIMISRVGSSGTIVHGWPDFGLPAAPIESNQGAPAIATDGSGGVFLTWQDDRDGFERTYATRITATGAVASGWPAAGLPVSPGPSAATTLTSFLMGQATQVGTLVSDGAGGAVAAWREPGTANRIVLQRLTGDGTTHRAWPAEGVVAHTGGGVQRDPVALTDDRGGVVLAWLEETAPTRWSLMARRVDLEAPETASSLVVTLAASVVPGDAPSLFVSGESSCLAWADLRTGTPRVRVARLELDAMRRPERVREAKFYAGGLTVRATGLAGAATLRLEYALPFAEPARLDLFDVTGRRVLSRNLSAVSGAQRLDVDVTALRSGVFAVRVLQAGRVATTRTAILR